MTEKILKDLLKILKHAKEYNLREASTLEQYLISSINPSKLKQIKNKTKNKLILTFINQRYKDLYSIKTNLEHQASLILKISTEDLLSFVNIDNHELHLIKRDYYYKYDSFDPSNYDADIVEFVELIRENITTALLSPAAYIRSLAEYVKAGEFNGALK